MKNKSNTQVAKLFEIQVEQFLSVKQVSASYGVSEKTVRGWVYKGLLKPIKVGPRLIRFKKEDIDQWISRKTGEIYGSD